MINRMIDPELIRVFIAASETGQVNRAAVLLGITPSAISQALRKLEITLSTELFFHDRRPLRLTPAGKVLLEEGKPIIAALKALKHRYASLEMPKASLRLGLGETITATISPWLVGAIYNRIAELEVHSSLNDELISKLKAEELDACVFSDGLLDEPHWVREPVFEEEYLLVTHKNFPKVRTIDTLRELAGSFPHVCYTNMSLDRKSTDRLLRQHRVIPRERLQTSSSYCLVGLISEVQGWALLPATNLLSGRELADNVCWSALPLDMHLQRRMWVLGDEKHRDEVHWLAKLTRKLFQTHTIEALRKVDFDLIKHVAVLAS